MLTTKAVHAPELDVAIAELVHNARRLVIGGLAEPACQALALLLYPGPWRLPAYGALVSQVQSLASCAHLLAGLPAPRVSRQEAMSVEQLSAWADQEAQRLLLSSALIAGSPPGPVGAQWSTQFLAALPDSYGGPGSVQPHLAFGKFRTDAELVLKTRLAARFDVSTAMMDMPSDDEWAELGLPDDEVAELRRQMELAGHVDVAPAAQAIDTLEIARATSNYLKVTGSGGGYLAPLFLPCWLLLVGDGRGSDAVEVACLWLDHDAGALGRMVENAAVPAVRDFLCSGALASLMGVNEQQADQWLAALNTRRSVMSDKAVAAGMPSRMALSSEALRNCLQGTPLAVLEWIETPIPGSDEHAWIAEIDIGTRRGAWNDARRLVDQTGHWPVVTTVWGRPEDLFLRSPYEQGPLRDDVTPRSFIASAQPSDAAALLAQLEAREVRLARDVQLDVWRRELERAGISSDGLDAVWTASEREPLRVERWLADLEARHGRADPKLGRQSGFKPSNAWLVLLPSPCPEHALAYMSWFGMDGRDPDGFIALLRAWRERFGAELWAHYGTMLEFIVDRPPRDLDEAFPLAREHDLCAPCTMALPGIALRHYALGLVGHGEWFLHERP